MRREQHDALARDAERLEFHRNAHERRPAQSWTLIHDKEPSFTGIPSQTLLQCFAEPQFAVNGCPRGRTVKRRVAWTASGNYDRQSCTDASDTHHYTHGRRTAHAGSASLHLDTVPDTTVEGVAFRDTDGDPIWQAHAAQANIVIELGAEGVQGAGLELTFEDESLLCVRRFADAP
jgi:hypothetical protein